MSYQVAQHPGGSATGWLWSPNTLWLMVVCFLTIHPECDVITRVKVITDVGHRWPGHW